MSIRFHSGFSIDSQDCSMVNCGSMKQSAIFLSLLLLCSFSMETYAMQPPAQQQSRAEKKAARKARRKAKKNQAKDEKSQAADEKMKSARPKIMALVTEMTDAGMRYIGNVEVAWETYRIFADSVEYDSGTRELKATGRVTLTSESSVISGSELVFNLKEKRGVMADANGMMQPSVVYSSDQMRIEDSDTLKFNRLSFTSCTQRIPRWEIRCRNGKIVKNRYIEMQGALFRIKKIPVFYLPYMRYPLQKDGKASGFLFPGIGNSSLRGFFLLNSFFWNIRPNLDLTLNMDLYSKVGLGFGQELRYLFPAFSGKINFYYLKYKENNALSPEESSDYYLDVDNRVNLGFLDSRLVVKANYPSDPNFLRLFNNNFDTVLMTRFGSSIHWSSSFRNITFSARASRNETYFTFNNTSRILETLPGIELNVNQQRIKPVPGYFSLKTSLERIERSGISYAGEPVFSSDVTSQRINLIPSYTLDLLKIAWLNTSVNLESRNSIYAKSIDPETNQVVDEPLHLQYNQAVVKMKGPVFFRIFEVSRSRIKHIIEPEITFRYVSQVDPDDLERLIRVDRFDFPPYSYLSFSLGQALLLKKRNSSESPREILRYTISQNYFLDEAEANLFLKIDGEYPLFSELSNRLRLRPMEDFSLDIRASYNYYIRDFRNFDVSLSFGSAEKSIKGAVTFSYYKNPYQLSNYAFNRTIVRGNLGIDHPDFPLKLRSALDYDFTENKFRYGSISLFYDYQCIRFQTEFKVFLRNGENDFQFRFGFSLGNLGMISNLMSVGEPKP